MCLWWHDYRRGNFPTLKFVVVIADLLVGHLLREELASPFACTECRRHHMGRRARAVLTHHSEGVQPRIGAETHSPFERA